jgi:hypothetical protein
MKQFEIRLNDEVGTLEKVAEALSRRDINIISISSERIPGEKATVRLVTSDEDKTREIMNEERLICKESEFLRVRLRDQPGELLKVTKLFSNSDINIESMYILNKKEGATEVAMIVNKMDAAKEALKKL